MRLLDGTMKQVHLNAKGSADRGRVRQINQDHLLVDVENSLFIVADGMGGHAGGEVASHLCVEAISKFFHNNEKKSVVHHPDYSIQNTMSNAINYASTEIYEKALEDPVLKGMGTTATTVKIFDNFAYCGHVGDSRLYLIRKGYIYQITNDHSLVSEQVRAGVITLEEAKKHRLKNIITRSVGYQEEEYVDTFTFPLEDQDLLIVCSDGLSNKVSNVEMSNQATKHKTESIKGLVELANERGGEDNITVIVIQVLIKS